MKSNLSLHVTKPAKTPSEEAWINPRGPMFVLLTLLECVASCATSSAHLQATLHTPLRQPLVLASAPKILPILPPTEFDPLVGTRGISGRDVRTYTEGTLRDWEKVNRAIEAAARSLGHRRLDFADAFERQCAMLRGLRPVTTVSSFGRNRFENVSDEEALLMAKELSKGNARPPAALREIAEHFEATFFLALRIDAFGFHVPHGFVQADGILVLTALLYDIESLEKVDEQTVEVRSKSAGGGGTATMSSGNINLLIERATSGLCKALNGFPFESGETYVRTD